MSWEQIVAYEDIVIFSEYSYIVNKIRTNKIVSESINNVGY